MYICLEFKNVVLKMLLFFFNDTATTEIYPLSLHDALPISCRSVAVKPLWGIPACPNPPSPCLRPDLPVAPHPACCRSEEHTSELQSQSNLVCRLLLEKKKKLRLFSADSMCHEELRGHESNT